MVNHHCRTRGDECHVADPVIFPLKASQRGIELSALRRVLIPSVCLTGKTPAGFLLKGVLRAIDDHGLECWASDETLAREVNCSERSIRTGLMALERLGLIAITRRGKLKVYRIVWETVFDIADAQTSKVDTEDLALGAKSLAPSSKSLAPSSKSLAPGAYRSDTLTEKLNDNKKRASACQPVDPYLLEICNWWNQLHTEKLVLSGVSTDPPSKAALRAWKKVTVDKSQLSRFQDLDAIKAAIKASYLGTDRGAWFTLPKLLGANGNAELIAEKLLGGCYVASQFDGRKKSGAYMGPGVNFDPALEGVSEWK